KIFVFQAEDGIRDYKVTGVQTCALPISLAPWTVSPQRRRPPSGRREARRSMGQVPAVPHGKLRQFPERKRQRSGRELRARGILRSEERRVGKECRCRWSACQ